jgi:proline dehydrogenase
VDDEEEWEVEEVLAHQFHYGKLQYLVKWAGWPSYENSWELAENLANAKEAVNDYHKQVGLIVVQPWRNA